MKKITIQQKKNFLDDYFKGEDGQQRLQETIAKKIDPSKFQNGATLDEISNELFRIVCMEDFDG